MAANKWTYEACLEEAKRYNSRTEFQKANGSAYQAAARNGWLDEYDWLVVVKAPNGYYDYERCLEIAKQCSSKSEMGKKNPTAYRYARNNGWVKDYTWFLSTHEKMSKSFTKWTQEKCFEEAQQYKSRGEFKKNNSSAYSVARKKGWLDSYDWFEVLWEKKWNYESCKAESKKYFTRGEFSEKSPSAWAVAKKNGWIEEYSWLELKKHENGFWTREACFEVAKQCTCVKEMYLLNGSAYNAARTEGWIKDYTWFQTPTLGSLDSDSKCYTIYVYEDPINKVCYVGLSKNWRKRHASHKRMIKGKSDTVKQYFDRMRKELPLPKILESGLTAYESQIQEDFWKQKYANEGWLTLNRATTGKNASSLGGGFIKWDYDACYQEALKYKSVSEFQRANTAAQRAARENGWQSDYVWLVKPKAYNKKWDYDTCFNEAKKYTTHREFRKNAPGACNVAERNRWIKDYTWFEILRKANGHWTESTCYDEARKYRTLKEFRTQSASCYGVARTQGWLSRYTWLKKGDGTPKKVGQYSMDGTLVAIYPSIAEACNGTGFNMSCVSTCCNGKRKSSKGYIWRFIDE